jgi:hypothetical protein
MPKKSETVSEGQDEFEAFIDEARASKVVGVFRLDPVVAQQNVDDGVATLRAVGDARIRRELPTFDLKSIDRAEKLARAVAFAARRAEQTTGEKSGPLIAEVTKLRAKLLTAAVAFAAQGLIPQDKVDKIREGTGPIDAAQDCVDLAALFKKHAAKLEGKSPVAPADITRAAALGAELLGKLRPKGSRRAVRSKEQQAASRDRDALGTLLAVTYDPLRRAGKWLFGADSDDVPPLGSRTVTRKKKVTPAASEATKS